MAMGRWSWIKLEGQKTNLYVVTAYRVQQEKSEGTATAYTQQRKIFRKKGIDKPNPRKQSITDLIQQINKWKEDSE
eukprot:11573319-Ditylum_brightwellii.AAC.1